MSNEGGDIQPYEITRDTNSTFLYSNFNRFQHIIPPYIFQEMIGFSPQRRRAFLLQNKYLVPLSFVYAMLELAKKIGYYILFILILRLLWEYWLFRYHVIYFGILLFIFMFYVAYKATQSRNTKTIKEEMYFYAFSDALGFFFGLLIVFSNMILPLFH